MPFISIQSAFRRLQAIVPQIAFRVTNWLYDSPVNTTNTVQYGYSEISDDGSLMVTGAPNVVNVYQRLTGPNTPWDLMDTLFPANYTGAWDYNLDYNVGDRVTYTPIADIRWYVCIQPVTGGLIDITDTSYWQIIPDDIEFGASHVCISGDGIRVAFGAREGNTLDTDRGGIYVYRLDSGSWVLEQRLETSHAAIGTPVLGQNQFAFDTSTDVNGTTNTIANASLIYDPNEPLSRVLYTQNGSDNIGLVDGTEYWTFVGSSLTFFQGTTKPRLLDYGSGIGVWAPGTYEPGDYVNYGGVWYKCIQNTTYESYTTPDTIPLYWTTTNVVVDLTAGTGETHYLTSCFFMLSLNGNLTEIPAIKMNYLGDTLVTNRFLPGGSHAAMTVFVRSGTTWTEQQTVPLSAPTDNSYVLTFTRVAGTWYPTATIIDPELPVGTNTVDDVSRYSNYATRSGALAISNDGNTIACGITASSIELGGG